MDDKAKDLLARACALRQQSAEARRHIRLAREKLGRLLNQSAEVVGQTQNIATRLGQTVPELNVSRQSDDSIATLPYSEAGRKSRDS